MKTSEQAGEERKDAQNRALDKLGAEALTRWRKSILWQARIFAGWEEISTAPGPSGWSRIIAYGLRQKRALDRRTGNGQLLFSGSAMLGLERFPAPCLNPPSEPLSMRVWSHGGQ